VVYIFNSAVAGNYTFDLCESGYDTKIWVWDIELNCVGCNEDYCSDSSGNPYRSYLEIQNLPAGDYYIIVDGYGGEAGEYRLITDMESPQEYGNCQLPHSSDDEWSAGTSYDDSDEHNYLRADRFGDTGLISSIRFWGLSLATPARVALSVYNINGQLVDVIHDGFMPAGHHTAAWSPSDLASGVYIVKLRVDTYAVTQKMMYIK